MNQNIIIYLLGSTIETDKKTKRELLAKNGIPYFRFESATRLVVGEADKYLLLHDESFAFSLRLALCRNIAKNDTWRLSFLKELEEIFPLSIASKLYLETLRRMNEDLKQKGNFFPEKEEIQKHFEKRQLILKPFFKENCSRFRPFSACAGTDTRMEKCPQCGTPKRVDAKTKRFRCKCGFAKSYPFV